MIEPIVSSEWLNQHLDDPNLILLDASQSTEIESIQIPGARAIDLQRDFSLTSTHLPNMLPDAEHFEQACRRIGIHTSSKIVVYDNQGVHFSPRVWWMFKTMGHHNISVLNGGLPSWVANGFDTEPKTSRSYESGDFSASFNETAVKSFDDVQENIRSEESLLIDARSSSRFAGSAPEPRAGLRSGHIPQSINLPYERVLENGFFKPKDELIRIFDELGVEDRPLIFSCGSGVTACIILLACEQVRGNRTSVYDGSWTEWAERTRNG
jgi:thiosulfate/3-mercaptopyruvate sulfurtransferase